MSPLYIISSTHPSRIRSPPYHRDFNINQGKSSRTKLDYTQIQLPPLRKFLLEDTVRLIAPQSLYSSKTSLYLPCRRLVIPLRVLNPGSCHSTLSSLPLPLCCGSCASGIWIAVYLPVFMVIPVEGSSAMLCVFATMLVGICQSKCAGQYWLSLYLGGLRSPSPFGTREDSIAISWDKHMFLLSSWSLP